MQIDAATDLGELGRRLGNSYALLRSIIRRSAESACDMESFAWHLEGLIGRIMPVAMREPGARFDLKRLMRTSRATSARTTAPTAGR